MPSPLPAAFLGALVALVVLGTSLWAPAATSASPEAPAASPAPAPAEPVTPAIAPMPQTGSTTGWGAVCTSIISCSPGNPGSLAGSAGAYDAADGYAIVFGGSISMGNYYTLATNETLKFSTSTPHWSTINANGANGAPTPRRNAAITYDWRDGYVLLFGGTSTTTGTDRNDTWSFHAGTWTKQASGPQGLKRIMGSAMADYPGSSGFVLLFGGCDATHYYANTWKYVGGTWTNVSSSAGTPPAASCGGSLVYDAQDGYFVYFGGFTASGAQNGTWKFDPSSSTWSQLYAAGANGQPNPRGYSTMGCLLSDGDCYLFSGAYNTQTNAKNRTSDVWRFTAGTWVNISSPGLPGNGPTTGWWNAAVWNTSNAFYLEGGVTKAAGTTNQTYSIGAQIQGVTLQSNYGEVVNGSSLTIYTNVSGGVGPFSYTYSGLPGCPSVNTSVLSCLASVPGFYSGLSVQVFDAGTGFSAQPQGIDFPLTVDPGSVAYAALQVNSYIRLQPGSFWGINLNAPDGFSPNATNLALLNQSVFSEYRFGDGAGTNFTTCTTYNDNGVASACKVSLSAFIPWCQERNCHVDISVPMETDDMGAIAYEVRYLEQTLGFTPAAWGLGNEPTGWIHWGIPWTSWRASDHSTPTAAQLAAEVKTAVSAIRSVDGTTPIDAIQSSTCSSSYVAQVMLVNGPNVTSVACHAYPGGGTSTANPPHNLAQFLSLGGTQGSGGIARLGSFRTGLQALDSEAHTNCPTGYSCSGIREYVDELNSYLGGNGFSHGFPEVPAAAALEYFALIDPNVTGTKWFEYAGPTYGLFGSVPNGARPAWYLYSEIFRNLTQGDVYNVTFTGPERNLLGIETRNASTGTSSLLLINDNASVSFLVDTSAWYPGTTPRTWAFAPGMSYPSFTASTNGSFERLVTLAPEEVLLIDFANASAASSSPVTGLPPAPPSVSASVSSNALGGLAIIAAAAIMLVVVLVAALAPQQRGRSGRRLGR